MGRKTMIFLFMLHYFHFLDCRVLTEAINEKTWCFLFCIYIYYIGIHWLNCAVFISLLDRLIKIILSCTCFILQDMSHLFVAGPVSLTKNVCEKLVLSVESCSLFLCSVPKPESNFFVLRNHPLLHLIQVSRFPELT